MKFKTTSGKLKQYSNSYHENKLPRHQFHSLQYIKELACLKVEIDLYMCFNTFILLQSYCPGQNLCCLKYQKTYKVSKSPIMNINLDNSTKNTDFEK